MKVSTEAKNMASLVTFRQLYDDGRRDIYEILSKFIENSIISSNKYSFGLIEMSEMINEHYGFIIPDYVIKTSIKKLRYVKQEGLNYSVDTSGIKENDFSKNYNAIMEQNNIIIDDLYNYVVERRGELLPEQQALLTKDFYCFLLEDSNGNSYSDLISGFILERKGTKEEKQIRLIKEGAILYTGINYNANISERAIWKDTIYIYVENEILFHLAGYNGEVFKRIASDLMFLIQEMNGKAKKAVIKVCYFEEVKKEIDDFFLKAQDIVEGKDIISVGNDAMKKIVDGCKTPSDVIEKKTMFFRMLSKYGIKEAPEHNYYSEINHKYNLESPELVKKYDITEDKIRYIKHLNYISILRKGNKQNDLKKVKHIVLTETRKILKISNEIREQEVPFATNTYVFTNRLWYDLNKGFGAKNFPATFDVLVKSQIVLSSLISHSVTESYENLNYKFLKKEITKEDLIEGTMNLREEMKSPEDITENNVKEILDYISEADIKVYQSEKEKLSSDLNKTKIEIYDLNNTLSYKDNEIQKKDNEIKSKDQRILLFVIDKKKSLQREEEKKKKCDKTVKEIFKLFKVLEILLCIFYICIVFFTLLKTSDRQLNLIMGILAFVLPVIGYITSIIFNKTFSIEEGIKLFNEKVYKKIEKNIYGIKEVKLDEIDKLRREIDEYEKENIGK